MDKTHNTKKNGNNFGMTDGNVNHFFIVYQNFSQKFLHANLGL